MDHILFIKDTFIQFYSFDKGKKIQESLIDLPNSIMEDGLVMDGSHLYYLIKKYFEENSFLKENAFIVLQSSSVLSKMVEISSYRKKSPGKKNTFITDTFKDEGIILDEYQVFVNFFQEGENGILSLLPKKILSSYKQVFKLFKKDTLYYFPLEIPLFSYQRENAIGQVWNIDNPIFALFAMDSDKVYSKYIVAEAINKLYSKNPILTSEIPLILKGTFDARTTEIDKESFAAEFYQSMAVDLNFLSKVSENMPGGKDFILYDSVYGKEDISLSHFLPDNSNCRGSIDGLPIAENILAKRNIMTECTSHEKKPPLNLAYIYALLAILILAFSFFYGQSIKKDNKLLENKRVERNISKETTKVSREFTQEDSQDIGSIFTLIQATKPDTIEISRLTFENNQYEVSGQVNDSEALDQWIQKLEEEDKLTINKEPSTSVDGMDFFKFTIEKGNNHE